jgi:hypothetical protein
LKAPRPQTTVEEYVAVLRASESQPTPQIIVGGQAVSIWADRYISIEPELQKYLPFTSKDLDLPGDKFDLDRLARLTGYAKIEARPDRWIPSAGYLEIPRPGFEPVKEEILKRLYGATTEEVRDSALVIQREDMTLHVAHPITLLRDKTATAVHLPQDKPEEERQDVRHLKMMVLCVRGFLKEQVAACENGKLADKDCLDLVQATFQVATSLDAEQARGKHEIDVVEALPVTEIENSSSQRLKNFVEQQLRRWLTKNR